MRVDYFISGVWKEKDVVTFILVHKNTPEGFTTGLKMQVHEVMLLVKEGFCVHAIRWNYDNGCWSGIARVELFNSEEGLDHLQLLNNTNLLALQNLIPMNILISNMDQHPVPLVRKRTKSA